MLKKLREELAVRRSLWHTRTPHLSLHPMDTFLEQARHWLSTEAGHHHHHSPPPRQSHSPILHQHQQPPAPLSPPVLPNQPPPRSIGEAVSRCVTAENRAISLQAALDRYAAQSEIMEVRLCGAEFTHSLVWQGTHLGPFLSSPQTYQPHFFLPLFFLL